MVLCMARSQSMERFDHNETGKQETSRRGRQRRTRQTGVPSTIMRQDAGEQSRSTNKLQVIHDVDVDARRPYTVRSEHREAREMVYRRLRVAVDGQACHGSVQRRVLASAGAWSRSAIGQVSVLKG